MSGDVEVREALDRLTQAAKDYAGIDDPDSMEAVDEDYRLVGAALADAERTAGEQIQANFALTAQLQAAQQEITKTDAAFAALKQQHAASDVALIDAKAIIAEALAVEPVGLAHWTIRRILKRAVTPTENGENTHE